MMSSRMLWRALNLHEEFNLAANLAIQARYKNTTKLAF